MKADSDSKSQDSPIEPLSRREIQILNLIADNLSKREIAEKLSLAYNTVKWYTRQSYRKLGVNSRREAVLRAREFGLMGPQGLVQAEAGVEPEARIPNPYKGLLAFQEADAANFFGRETLTDRLISRLMDENVGPRFLAVVGPSGSGKSSLVKAGLIPALRRGDLPGSEDWYIAEMTPGIHPFRELESSLQHISGNSAINHIHHLQRDDKDLLHAVRLALSSQESELLLVIDQFEETFTLVDDRAEARNFLNSLCAAVTTPHGRVWAVITIRVDFLDKLLLDPVLSRLVQDHTEMVIPLTTDEMERAIRAPAEQAGVRMESGLVAAIVADMVDQPGALPLLQYALTETFEQQANRQLTLKGYQAIGRVRGVLERRAEETFDGLSPAGKIAARQVFLRLVTLGEGMSAEGFPVPDTRRRALRYELEAVAIKSLKPLPDPVPQERRSLSAIAEVLDAFGKVRLLFFDRDAVARSSTVEIAHEALLSEWGRLLDWLEEGREDVRMQRALGRAAVDWVKANRDPSFLLRGTRLSLFEDWNRETDLALTIEERIFLEASLAERQRLEAEEAARQAHERLLERRSRNFLIGLVGVFALAAVGALLLMSFARKEASLSTSRELASVATSNLETDPELSILLSLQGLRAAYTHQAEDALHLAIQSSRVRLVLTGLTGGARSVAYSPDSKTIATASGDNEVTVWEAISGQKLFSLPGRVARYSPDGSRLAAGDDDGTVRIWELATRKKLLTLNGHQKGVKDLHFNPDGRMLVSSSLDDTFIVWDIKSGEKLFTSSARTGGLDTLYNVTFSPDGRLLVSSDFNNTGQIDWKVWGVDRDWALLNKFSGNSMFVFSPDGRWLAAPNGASQNDILLWDLSKLSSNDRTNLDLSAIEPFRVPAAHNNVIRSFAFSSDGTLLATADLDSTAKVWQISSDGLNLLTTMSGQKSGISDVSFSPDSSLLATAGYDGSVRIWDITSNGASEWFTLAAHHDRIRRFGLTADGKYLATASPDGTAKVWDLASRRELITINDSGEPLFGVDISPDGSLLATSGYDNVARIWKLNLTPGTASAELVHTLTGHAGGPPVGGIFPGLTTVIFSPDGTKLATGGVDKFAKVWNLETGQELLSVLVDSDGSGVTRLAFSPDGRFLATASDDLPSGSSLAIVWEIASGRKIATYTGHNQTGRIWSMAFSPDGRRVATGGGQGALKIWNASTGEELLSLSGHTSTVLGVDFSPDGKYLVSSSSEGIARVWNIVSGEVLQTYTSPGGPFLDAKFTPDGKNVIISGAGFVYGYVFDVQDLIRLAKSRLTRGLTPAECLQYLHQKECPQP